MNLRAFLAAGLMSLASAAIAVAQTGDLTTNWPQWRGPLGTGAAPAGKPPVKWDQATNIKWKVRLPGDGTSTPILWGERIFIQTALPAKGEAAGGDTAEGAAKAPYKFVLLCLDRATGKELWQRVCREEVPHEGFRPGDGSFAAASAMTDGEHVYAFFGSRGLYCFDLAGNLKWEKDLGDQQTRNGFGEGSTPALFGNTIVVPWDHEAEDFIVALDKRTGGELWRQERDEPTTWATPLIVEHQGRPQVIASGTNRLICYDLATGRIVWQTEGLTLNAIPSPLTAAGVVYATAGYRGTKLLAIRLGGSGDITGTPSVLWRYERDTPYVPTPLLSGNRLYFFKSNFAVLSCLDIETGKPLYAAKRIGNLGANVYASPVAAGGHVYLTGRNGTTVVIKDAAKFEIVSVNELDDPTDASPAVVGNELFVRSRRHLYCIGEK